MVAKGSFRNPTTRPCFVMCKSCHRCEKRGSSACPFVNTCSGRPDVEGMREPHPDDLCYCKQGIMRWVTKQGRLIIRPFKSSPFEGQVKTDARSQDDSDWSSYLNEKREQLDDPNYDPIQFTDGSSTTDWARRHRGY